MIWSFALRIPRWFEVPRKTASSTPPVISEMTTSPSHGRPETGASRRSKPPLIAAFSAAIIAQSR